MRRASSAAQRLPRTPEGQRRHLAVGWTEDDPCTIPSTFGPGPPILDRSLVGHNLVKIYHAENFSLDSLTGKRCRQQGTDGLGQTLLQRARPQGSPALIGRGTETSGHPPYPRGSL